MTLRLLAGMLLATLAGAVHADDKSTPDYPIFDELDRIIVTATLNERPQKDVASEVSVIDAETIDHRQVQSLADLLRYEPGVAATGSDIGGGRFGTSGISIRGLGGNRVRIEQDGIAIPDAFEIGSFSSAGRDVVDVDALKRVEIVRGAASSLYGSDALGGVVSFITKDPVDYVGAEGGQFASVKWLYDSADREDTVSATYAGGKAHDGLVLVATHRDGHALNNGGDVDSDDATRTRPNPQDTRNDALLAKYVHTAASGRVDRLTLDADRGEIATDVLSGIDFNPQTFAITNALDGADQRERLRLSFDEDIPFASAIADSLAWKTYVQRSTTTQDTFEDRLNADAAGDPVLPVQRFRRFEFDQRVLGAEATLRKAAQTGAIEHALTYGIDVSRTHTEESRDGYERDLDTGNISNVVPPDTFPVHDFPITDTTTAVLFGQDEIRAFGGRLSLTPGVRVDYYRLTPQHDPIYAVTNPNPAAKLDDTSWSPKFGAIWRFDDVFSAFAQYAHAFRAPPYADVNLGFTNLQYGYTSLPNPNLKPETSNGVELGLRASGKRGYFSLSAYQNRYHDFIESTAFVGFDPVSGLLEFQSINLGRVKIHGIEARYGLELGEFDERLRGWSVKGSLASARGEDETARQPLVSVQPARAVVGLAYDHNDWGGELVASFVARQDRVPAPVQDDPSVPATALFEAPGFSTLDCYMHWEALAHLDVFAALTNITDRKYFDWGVVGGFPQSGTIDRYSAPGRAIRVGVRATF